MKAIHGGKTKNDKIDSHKNAVLLRGGMLPEAYVYPSEMRSTRDLLRRRMHFMRKRAELLSHIQNTNSQYNLSQILSLVMLYEIHDINRFPRVQDFSSYDRLIKPEKESAGKRYGTSNKKIGNQHLKWAFSEAAILLLRKSEDVKKYLHKMESRHGKPKALSILASKLGKSVYYMLKCKRRLI